MNTAYCVRWADGVLIIEPSDTCDFKMRIFNSDGSEGEMCGNQDLIRNQCKGLCENLKLLQREVGQPQWIAGLKNLIK